MGNAGDTLFGQADDDLIFGGNGDDGISGGTGNDRIVGDAGNDVLVGDAGADTVEGSDGNDQGFGGAGTEWMAGDIGNDTLDGGTEGDKVDGKLGNDRLFGNAGDDFLIGDEPGTPLAAGGLDRLEGGAGNDLIYGGKQQDFLWGDGQAGFGGVPTPAAERGIDVFQFDKGDSLVGAADTIFDFEVTRDSIELDTGIASTPTTFATAPGPAVDEAQALDFANDVLNGTVVYAAVRVGTDTFLFIDNDGNGFADVATILAGVQDSDLLERSQRLLTVGGRELRQGRRVSGGPIPCPRTPRRFTRQTSCAPGAWRRAGGRVRGWYRMSGRSRRTTRLSCKSGGPSHGGAAPKDRSGRR